MNRLKELRIQCGLSLRKLQAYTGIDFSRLAVIEKTDANLEIKTVERLASFYRVSSTYLLGGDGFVFYFDQIAKKFFPLPFEQYKDVLTKEVVSVSIVDGCVKRVISGEGYDRISECDERYKQYADVRQTTEGFLQFLDCLEPGEFERQKERILEFFEMRQLRR